MSGKCVCGCPEDIHSEMTMSVEFPPNPDPLYPMPTPTWPGISRYVPSATYTRRECDCGSCGDYEADL
jgi:hypothetical protein